MGNAAGMQTAAFFVQLTPMCTLGSSQSRVAKMEVVSSDVSLDLICRALFALGVCAQQIGKILTARQAA